MNFFGRELPVFKAALHTHSTCSDGRFRPEEVIAFYEDAGFDVLAFTDHGKVTPVSAFRSRMALIQGIEMHPAGLPESCWHIVALHVPEDFVYDNTQSAQQMVDHVRSLGGVCIAAHPYWCGFSAGFVGGVSGFAALEVYNSSARYIGKAYNMQLWDELLDSGTMLPAVAVDDFHSMDDFNHGWTMVAAPECTPEAITTAIREGSFYATQGPRIESLEFSGGVFRAKFSPCTEVVLMTGKWHGIKGQVASEAAAKGCCTSFEADVSALPLGSYLRLQLMDGDHNYAWSAPVAW